ncbi:AMED_5909 family protein [Amycolatopsis saalfeldensis]|uniref:AMED_5909 family protein n=1 Tax=Amycolatopsis saalfeldensis TaxID=394193 RepID=UPI001FE73DE6|nr:AMED_5909 family protein [Amycolatopsis saalfeldensis]
MEKLADAHDDAERRRPEQTAMPSKWIAFHRANARMYERVADIDRGHHHEALYWADRERRNVDEVEAAATLAVPGKERKEERHG